MELSRHAQVLWRFRVIIVAGVLAGLVLATGTLFSVSSSGLKWRAADRVQELLDAVRHAAGIPVGAREPPDRD